MTDLTTATNCINAQRKNHTYKGARIGIVVRDCTGMVSTYHPGRVVLFTEQLSPSNSQLCMGEYRGMEQRPTGRITLEIPLSPEEISKQRAQGSLITAVGTIINVPRDYVEEVKV